MKSNSNDQQIWAFYNELTDFKEKYKNLVDEDLAKADEEE